MIYSESKPRDRSMSSGTHSRGDPQGLHDDIDSTSNWIRAHVIPSLREVAPHSDDLELTDFWKVFGDDAARSFPTITSAFVGHPDDGLISFPYISYPRLEKGPVRAVIPSLREVAPDSDDPELTDLARADAPTMTRDRPSRLPPAPISVSDPLPETASGKPSLVTTGSTIARHRTPNWSSQEKSFIQIMQEAQMREVKGKPWGFISEALLERHGYARAPKSCENLWGTFLKHYKAIQAYQESMFKSDPGSSTRISYWDIDEDARAKNNLPRSFSFEWYQRIERIRVMQGKRPAEDDQAQWIKTSTRSGIPSPVQKSLGGCESEYSGCPHPVDPAYSGDGLNDRIMIHLQEASDSNTMAILMAKLSASPIFLKVVTDAVNSALEPTSSVLRGLDQDDQEYYQELQAIKKKKRALDLEEQQLLKRQRLNRHQRTRRTGRYKPQAVLHVKNPAAKAIIPAFQELNIEKDQQADNVGFSELDV